MNTPLKSARSHFVVGVLLLGLVFAVGCGDKTIESQKISSGAESADAPEHHAASDQPKGDHPSGDHPSGDHPAGDHPSGNTTDGPTHPTDGIHVAGVNFIPPANWRDLGESGMRKAQLRFGPVDDDQAEGELNVFYFGEASGGGVAANLDRWIGQMEMPDGSEPAASAVRSHFEADGMAGHVVALSGSYKSGGGRPMGGETTLLAGYRLVGVVVEGPQGSLFFKLTGPEATVKAMEKSLMDMVQNARR